MVVALPAAAQVCSDDLGLGVTLGMMQPSGGDNEFEDSGLAMGLEVRKLLTDGVSVVLDYRRGVTQSGSPEAAGPELLEARFGGWGQADYFRTVWNHAGLSAHVKFMPDGRVHPFVSAGLGLTFWEVQDWREEAADQGAVPDGYDTDGRLRELSGTNLTAIAGLGAEVFVADRLSVTLGGRYHYLLQNKLDNVGLSVADGPDYADANNSVLEGYVALTYYFGAGDCDGDGIVGRRDLCWREAEDFDGFQDDDGCPDPDNDGDGYLDVDDACPDEPEDFDGEDDEDGCPDIDRDGDGVPDDIDKCPDAPEDADGFQDEDGCPDLDNDGDGVPDDVDKCAHTPKGVEVDATGCPKPKLELVAVMVHFELGSAELLAPAKDKLDALARALVEDPEYTVEVAGHACDLGPDKYNEGLSRRRAEAVVAYLMDKGIDKGRMSVVAYGETAPLVPNDSEEHRRANRRVVITPFHP